MRAGWLTARRYDVARGEARDQAPRALDLERRRDEGEALWLLARVSTAGEEQGAALEYAREALRLFEPVEHPLAASVRGFVERGGGAGAGGYAGKRGALMWESNRGAFP